MDRFQKSDICAWIGVCGIITIAIGAVIHIVVLFGGWEDLLFLGPALSLVGLVVVVISVFLLRRYFPEQADVMRGGENESMKESKGGS